MGMDDIDLFSFQKKICSQSAQAITNNEFKYAILYGRNAIDGLAAALFELFPVDGLLGYNQAFDIFTKGVDEQVTISPGASGAFDPGIGWPFFNS